ncbi:DUF2264 domain-containing protein [Vibrio sonorensis]|uniref:DUF2264 domain-containing protein n=1 Tax=Vibrio sonorensis TaxID=1004316 RepID=UPI0008DB1704|nr:DUF2264 domain-containing protein [Vibrio sonorensis]
MAISLNQLMMKELSFQGRDEVLAVMHKVASLQTSQIGASDTATSYQYSAAHYDLDTTKIEHVCRLLWGVIPMGDEGINHHRFLVRQIVKGTTPEDPGYWQMPKNYDQRVVEMSAIAVGLFELPQYYWYELSESEKVNLVEWLSSVSALQIPPNNWRWFRILILTALDHLGQTIDRDVLSSDLAFIDELYLNQGWYQDGSNGVLDYYNPFAFQLYALMYCRWNHYQGPLCEKMIARAVEFADTYQIWFGDDGKQLAYGRSLNYRFASAGFWVELSRVPKSTVDVALCRSIWTETMSWWSNQPIWDTNGQILPGFAYPNLLSSEFYTSSVSPMLALKAFNALSLTSEHSFWNAPVRPLATAVSPLWIADRHLVWRNGGSYMLTNAPSAAELRNSSDKYTKCAYSSDHGICVEATKWIEQGWLGDNIFAVKHPETNEWIGQSSKRTFKRVGDALVTHWQPFAGCDIVLTQQLNDGVERRTFHVECDKTLPFIMSGYAVDKWSAWFSHLETNNARVQSDTLYSELELITGSGESAIYPCAPNTNLLYQRASVPAIRGDLKVGHNELSIMVTAGRLNSYANKANHSITSNKSHQGVTDEY